MGPILNRRCITSVLRVAGPSRRTGSSDHGEGGRGRHWSLLLHSNAMTAADHTTHLKIVIIALVIGIARIGLGLVIPRRHRFDPDRRRRQSRKANIDDPQVFGSSPRFREIYREWYGSRLILVTPRIHQRFLPERAVPSQLARFLRDVVDRTTTRTYEGRHG